MARARSMGAYQPRARSAQWAERLEEARTLSLRLAKTLAFRCGGLSLLLSSTLALIALVTYNAHDGSLNNATGVPPSNLLGGVGATAADLLLQSFGFAALAAIAAPGVWGAKALFNKSLRYAVWRLIAWPLGTIFVAAGLGIVPAPFTLPAGSGGLIGIAAVGLSKHAALAYGESWIGIILPLALLLAGLPLAFLSTGLKMKPLLRGASYIPAFFFWIGSSLHVPQLFPRRAATDIEVGEEEESEYEDGDEDEDSEDGEDEDDDGAYHLEDAPEPRTGERAANAASRIKREDLRKQAQAAAAKAKLSRQPALALASGDYELPPLGLLAEAVHIADSAQLTDDALEENARMLEAVLADFGVRGRIVAVRPGPVVTLYEFEPAAGVKSSRVISLSDDVARSMSAVAARIAVIPGRNVMGIELPNIKRETVYLRELFASPEYEKIRAPLILALGKTIGGEPVMADLAKMPHLLIAGTTGSGKSVALNTMILSLLYRLPPSQCRMILIDPKMLELSVYEGIPHLLAPVVTDPKKAVVALKWTVREMEERYRKMSKLGVRGVEAFNERVRKARDKGEVLKRTVQTGFDRETGKPVYEDETLELEPMSYIVVVVDEMADLMMISGKEIEGAVQRLAQMARAAGIHLIAATQRPSVDVITGTIKANFPTRISFQVTSKIDSRTILGEQGAEQLLGQGDMLYMMAGGRIRRVHGPFVSDHEVEDVVKYLKTQGTPEYLDAVTEEQDDEGEDPYALYGGGGGNGDSGDRLYDQAMAIVARERKATTSYIQRRLEIGYNRAARIIERMEEEGVISRPNHQGKREVLLPETHER